MCLYLGVFRKNLSLPKVLRAEKRMEDFVRGGFGELILSVGSSLLFLEEKRIMSQVCSECLIHNYLFCLFYPLKKK